MPVLIKNSHYLFHLEELNDKKDSNVSKQTLSFRTVEIRKFAKRIPVDVLFFFRFSINHFLRGLY